MIKAGASMRGPMLAYVDGAWELTVLSPVVKELQRIGVDIEITEDFSARSDIGLFACHGNRFFDFSHGNWIDPPSAISILFVHDFEQVTATQIQNFMDDGWHRFDLALVPNRHFLALGQRADHLGYKLPRHGLKAIGWTPADAFFARTTGRTSHQSILSPLPHDGLARKTNVLLACSWSKASQILDCHSVLGTEDFHFIVRYPSLTPPDAANPWENRLRQAAEDINEAIAIATTLPATDVPSPATDLFDLLSSVDVVVSNGSNVLFEGLLVGKPGICVTDWTHPSGLDGGSEITPNVSVPGILTGTLDALPSNIRRALDGSFAPELHQGMDQVLPKDLRGDASRRATKEILKLLKSIGVRAFSF